MLHRVEKKVNNSYITWFEESNRWIQFEEPAWFVKKLHQKGQDSHTISLKFARKYHLPQHKSLRFVDEIREGIVNLTVSDTVTVTNLTSSHTNSGYSFIPYATRHYLIGNKRFALNFETRLAEYYIHPPLEHLEVEYLGKADFEFEIYGCANAPALREKNQPETVSTFEDFSHLKKRLFITMVNAIYDKTNNDWMSFVHASAVTDGKQTLLLSSASGSGKSSMAALLQTKGLRFVSDDFVPIDVKNKRAFPFPAGISVKEGAFPLLSPLYGNLQDKSFNNYEYTHRAVRYLTPTLQGSSYYKAWPVKSIVFIRYNPLVSCYFKPVPLDEALKLFHREAWVSGHPEHARAFINWFVKLRCYSLEYGNTEEGIRKMMGIFEG